MKKILIVLLLSFTVLSFSETIVDVFKLNTGNEDYQIILLDREIYTMDYEKGEIESTNQLTDLNNDSKNISNQKSLNNSLKSYYTDLLGTVIDYLNAGYSLQTAKINYDESENTLENNKKLLDKKLITTDDYNTSKISFSESEMNLKNAQKTYDDAAESFREIYSKDISTLVIPLVDFNKVFVSDDEYLGKNFDVKSSEINLSIAKYNKENASYGTSEYEKKMLDSKLQKAQISYNNTKKQAEKTLKTLKINIENSYNKINNSKEKIEMYQRSLDDSQKKYDSGLISASDLNKTKQTLINEQKNYYSLLKDYLVNLINYAVDSGNKPEEVLN